MGTLLAGSHLGCTGGDEEDGRPACIEAAEAEVFAAHLDALGTTRDLLAAQASDDRAVGVAVPPAAGILGVVGIDGPCREEARACANSTCWSAACLPEGWQVRLESPVPLHAGAQLEHVLLAREHESGRLVWTAEVGGLSPWAVAQRGVLAKGSLAVAEGYPRLREGHELVLRVSFPASGRAVGVVEADGEVLADVDGRRVISVGRCMQR